MCLRVMGRRNSVTPRSRIQVSSSLENAQVQRAISCTNVETSEYVSGIFLQTLNVRTFNHYAVWCVRLHQVHIIRTMKHIFPNAQLALNKQRTSTSGTIPHALSLCKNHFLSGSDSSTAYQKFLFMF